ncbi:ribonuclease H-like domain-containing protein [Mogibacterium pumilum]|uniref:YprB ribonuclease H-like domain-containing protein n=1 Tax=Mogibacterium pumilum TaxID=86332 RepID=A0A223ASI7_9FIRM|nr:ribonuclease H-like domain-containing protein [Mogibacterium pumilum]ASS37879.1 hypothetical protein AXF17_05090 [Mogibacterium pumilum]
MAAINGKDMKKFTRSYNVPIYSGQIFDLYHGELKPCIFDIETTGLSAQRGNKIILTACLTADNRGVTITQFLAESPYEEDRVIMATMDFLKEEGIDYLITYNGSSFDIPFMKQRLDIKRLPYTLNMYEFDLYNFIRSNTNLKSKVGSISQKNIEQHFGISGNRKDVISGRESIKLFSEYAVNQDSVIEKIILTHNREDVLQLCHLLNIIGRNNFSAVLGEADTDCGCRNSSEFGIGNAKATPNVRAGIHKSAVPDVRAASASSNKPGTSAASSASNETYPSAVSASSSGIDESAGYNISDASVASNEPGASAMSGASIASGVSNHRLDAALAQTGAGLPSAGGELTARPRLAAGCLTVTGRQLRAPHRLADDTDFAINANYFQETASSVSAEFIKENCSYQIRVPLEKHGNSQFIDVRQILSDAESSDDKTQIKCAHLLRNSDNLVNDYLLLVNDGKELNREINLFSILISTKLYRSV